MEHQVRLERSVERPTAVVRRRATVAELPRVIGEGCDTVCQVMHKVPMASTGRMVAVYLDDVMNLEIGAELTAPFAGSGEVVGSRIPGGRVATVTYFGPYHGLPGVHSAIDRFCADRGLTTVRPCWEVYGPWSDDPNQLRTDVYYLLEETGPAGTDRKRD